MFCKPEQLSATVFACSVPDAPVHPDTQYGGLQPPHGSVLIKEPYWSVRPPDPAADYWLQHWGCWTWWKRAQEEARCIMCDRGESFESRAVTAEAGSMCEACLFCIYPSTAAVCTVLFPEHRNTQTPSQLALRSTPQLKGGWGATS